MKHEMVAEPVSGTFELRWQWHRGDVDPSEERPDGNAAPEEPALAGPRPFLDEVTPGP